MLVEVLIFIFVLVLYDFVWSQRRPRNFPPGPQRWPIVGNFLQVGLEPYKAVMQMKKKYGDITGIYLGPKRAVFISNYQLIKQAFNVPALCGRPGMPYLAVQETGIFRGMITTSGKHWQEQRRFAYSYIRSGLRNGVAMESLILNEANELVNDINDKCGRPISTKYVFNLRTVNSLWSIITGEKYSASNSRIAKIMKQVENLTDDAAAQGFYVYFPKLSKMFPRITGYQNTINSIKPALKFMGEIISRHKDTYQEGVQRDFVDSYLQKIGTTIDRSSTFFGKTGEESLLHSLYHIFLGGSETVSQSMKWIVFLLAYHPEIQEKIYNTISKTLQSGEMPSLKHRQQLPFVEAVLKEVMRYSAMLPIGLLHEATEDVHFHEYFIPKGTMVIGNSYAVAHDPDVWGDPEVFRPERFLNDDETEMLDHMEIIPFSIGRRICPGESLARDELFIFTIRLFQSFKVEFDPNEPTPVLKYVIATILAPVNHKVIFSKRVF